MTLAKKYKPEEVEPHLRDIWLQEGAYKYEPEEDRPVYTIDTPPATVSGNLHLGHVYSYSHADFMARYYRMKGWNIYYPMGFDDNGLPTERLVEKRLGIRPIDVGRSAFIEKCLEISQEAEGEYRQLWQRLGLSIDWRYTYRTIDERCRRISQYSFIELYQKGLMRREHSPAIWCPECRTAIAQAELDDLDRESEFVTLAFHLDSGEELQIATTRPELLAACVAVFVHPEDQRFTHLLGKQAMVPHYKQQVPILADPEADPDKGTGVVMCCTFGDQTDVAWWRIHKLPLVEVLDRQGRMTSLSMELAGMTVAEARRCIKQILREEGLILETESVSQSVRVHERCDTPVEYIVTRQWFLSVLPEKLRFVELGDHLNWHPAHMKARYQAWVENLNWDWCISRQRYFGVPFPVWYCTQCGEVSLAEVGDLPVDPLSQKPAKVCVCGCEEFTPEEDVMDTWATSSLTPQIISQWREDNQFFARTYPSTLRPQAHEIIRTWAFYSIIKSWYHTAKLPWRDVLISGWGLAGEGQGKISKSRGGGPMSPMEMMDRYSADAVRYWAASTSPGKDSIISEEKIRVGSKLMIKLWNVARFAERFLLTPADMPGTDFLLENCTPADRWILARLQQLIIRVGAAFDQYEYANAKSEIENFFWGDLTDNYLEMVKQRLYNPDAAGNTAACWALGKVLLDLLKLLAPFLPYITDHLFRELYAQSEGCATIHLAGWSVPDPIWQDAYSIRIGEVLIEIATAVRRFKSERNLSLGTVLSRLQLEVVDPGLALVLRRASQDLESITRAEFIEVVNKLEPAGTIITLNGELTMVLEVKDIATQEGNV